MVLTSAPTFAVGVARGGEGRQTGRGGRQVTPSNEKNFWFYFRPRGRATAICGRPLQQTRRKSLKSHSRCWFASAAPV